MERKVEHRGTPSDQNEEQRTAWEAPKLKISAVTEETLASTTGPLTDGGTTANTLS